MDCRKLLGTVLCVIFVLSASAAAVQGENAPATDSVMTGTGQGSPPLPSQKEAGPPQGAGGGTVDLGPSWVSPRWTASAECIIWNRLGTASETLVSIYPVTPPSIPTPQTMSQLIVGQGTDRLYSDNLAQGFAAGPKVGLTCHGDDGCDWELSFFEIDGWNNSASIASGSYITPVFTAPGGFVQTTEGTAQCMGWGYATRLYNAEVNLRGDFCSRLTILAGFRWVNLGEDLQGTIEPSDRTVPFWDTKTRNNLYGLQIGEDWKILNYGRFSLDGLVKAGLFDNNAEEKTEVSIYWNPYTESASTNHVAFLGEMCLQCKYQLFNRLLLKAGYEAIWLQGVAVAPAQIPETLCHGPTDVHVRALGIDSQSGVFFQGANIGLEYAF